VRRAGEPVVGVQLRHVLADADADEQHAGIGEEAPDGRRDAVDVEELEDEAACTGAELEDGHLGGRPAAVVGLPLAVEPDDEPGATRVGGAHGADPLVGDRGVAGDGGVDHGGAEVGREASGGAVGTTTKHCSSC